MPCVVKGAQIGLSISAVAVHAVQLISHGSEGTASHACLHSEM